jgi:hypothetical protein
MKEIYTKKDSRLSQLKWFFLLYLLGFLILFFIAGVFRALLHLAY